MYFRPQGWVASLIWSVMDRALRILCGLNSQQTHTQTQDPLGGLCYPLVHRSVIGSAIVILISYPVCVDCVTCESNRAGGASVFEVFVDSYYSASQTKISRTRY